MDVIKEWAFSLCCCMVSGSLIYMLTPSKNLEKIFKITISLFMLCCMITPFVFGNIRFDDMFTEQMEEQSLTYTEDLNATIHQQLVTTMSDIIKNHTKSILTGFGIEKSEITINMNVDDKSGILINQIDIAISDKFISYEQEIIRQIEKELGKKPQITYTKEGD